MATVPLPVDVVVSLLHADAFNPGPRPSTLHLKWMFQEEPQCVFLETAATATRVRGRKREKGATSFHGLAATCCCNECRSPD